jgi:hypothetical protein
MFQNLVGALVGDRATRLGNISKFWLQFKGPIWFVIGILRVQREFVEDGLDFQIKL